jgi:hypothetical protein
LNGTVDLSGEQGGERENESRIGLATASSASLHLLSFSLCTTSTPPHSRPTAKPPKRVKTGFDDGGGEGGGLTKVRSSKCTPIFTMYSITTLATEGGNGFGVSS